MNLIDRWRSLDLSCKFAIVAYLIARIALSAWSLVIVLLFPILVQNLDLFANPVLAYFDLLTGERYAYSRQVDGAILTFRAGENGFVVDHQTSTAWSMRDGRSVSGKSLVASSYSIEDIFPYRGVTPNSNLLLSAWQRFDTNWYLKIAQRGYSADDGSTVYFPLYPFLIGVVSFFVGDGMLAGLLVSNLSAVGALALVYRLSAQQIDEPSARRTIVYWLLFPTGFFLLAAYTESLFLFFTLASFLAAKQNRWLISSLFGALAALTRLQGVLLIVPLAWMLWHKWRSTQHAARNTQYAIRALALLLIPLSTVSFLAFTNLSLLASYESELHARFVMPWDNVIASVALLWNGQGSLIDALNLIAMILFGVMLLIVWNKLPREFGVYSFTVFFAPLFRMTTTQPLVSMDRYVLAVFPVFMLWGAWGKNAWVNRAVVYLSFPLQLYLTAQFVMWGWVG